MKALEALLKDLNIENYEELIEKFEIYRQGILEWNEKVNLTAITDPDEFEIKHFADSLITAEYPEYKLAGNIIDVGTGAGFPGVPLAIISPEKKFVLNDSLNKRLRIIDELTEKAGILNTVTVHARAEELARNKEHREKYDLCVSRAVANLTVLAEYCLPFIKPGGTLLAYKGPEAENEARDAAKAIKVLGGELTEIRETGMAEYGIYHKVAVIKKTANTPAKYPRKPGTAAKEPIR